MSRQFSFTSDKETLTLRTKSIRIFRMYDILPHDVLFTNNNEKDRK